MTRLLRILSLLLLLLPTVLVPLEQYLVQTTAAAGGSAPDSGSPLSYDANSLAGLTNANPADGITLIAPPETNNKGEAHLSYPIEVPKGRNGMQPDLELTYNSAASNGWMGLGWDLRTSAITIDTRWGVPRYDVNKETETYTLDGMDLTPLARRDPNSGPEARNTISMTKTFHARVEENFEKITRHGNSPSTYWWEIVDKTGNRFFYGADAGANKPLPQATLTDRSDEDGKGNIFMWPLREVRDLHGNGVKYNYVHVMDPRIQGSSAPGYQLYLDSITYTQSGDTTGPFEVKFYRDDSKTNLPNFFSASPAALPTYHRRSDVDIDARGGFKMVTASLLKRIDVNFNRSLVSRYDFLYEERAFKKTVLHSVTQYGADADTKGATSFTHTFEYFDDARNGADYKGFQPARTWNTQNDSLSALPTMIPLNGSASALSGAVSAGIGVNAYIGFNPLDPTKEGSAGGKIGFNYNDTEVTVALIDLNGDGLPDKVFRKPSSPGDILPGDWPVYFRLNQDGASATSRENFSTAQTDLPALNDKGLGQDTDLTFSGGAEVYLVGNFIYSDLETFTTGSVYFSDVNADGLPDLVSNGQVWFNHLVNGVPNFDCDSSQTEVPIGKSSADAGSFKGNYDSLRQKAIEKSPPVDSVRRWVAPYDGKVKITGTVALVNFTVPQDATNTDDPVVRARKDYKLADGVRVAIQKNKDELWSATIGPNDYSPKTPSSVDSIDVKAGDALYFRVGSVFDGKYDVVNWNPGISYLNVQQATDLNGLDEYNYQAGSDFTAVGSNDTFVKVAMTGTLHIEGALQKHDKTTDDVTLEVLKNGTSIYSKEMDWDKTGDIALPPDFSVVQSDTIQLRLKVDSPIDIHSLRWNPSLYYVATDPPQKVMDNGKYLFQLNLPYNVDIYPKSTATSPEQTWTAPDDGTLTVSPSLSVKKPDKAEDTDKVNSDVVLTVKRNGGLVGKTSIPVSKAVPKTQSFTVDVKKDDRLYFDFSVRDPGLASLVEDSSVLVGFNGAATDLVPSTRHSADKPDVNALHYRNWSYLGYKGDGDWETKAIDPDRLTVQGNIPPKKDNGDYNFDNYDPTLSVTAYMYGPFSGEGKWRGTAPDAWVSATQISSSRLGGPTINVPSSKDIVPSSACMQGATAVFKSGHTTQHAVGGGAVFFGYSNSNGNSYGDVDYLDMNGDDFPDVVAPKQIQYTNANGVLDDKPSTVGAVDYVLDSKNWAENFGISGNVASFKGSSTGEVGASGKRSPRGNNSGSQMATFGFTGDFGHGTSAVQTSFIDMNGDGLPDKVRLSNGNLLVSLNLGYRFADEETWATKDENKWGTELGINSGSSTSGSVGVAAGFNGGDYDFGGGVSLDMNTSKSKQTLDDINGDDLPDFLTTDGHHLSVALNTGSGFATPVEWKGGPPTDGLHPTTDGVHTTANVGAAAGLYFTIGIGPLCLPAPLCYVIINPGGEVSYNISRQESTLVDVDGDGAPDFVTSSNDSSMSVARNSVGRTNLLQKVTEPLGATISLDYKRDGNTYQQPQSTWVLSTVSVFDGQPGDGVDTQVTTYSYQNGIYNRFEREFYGYGRVIATQLDDAGKAYRSVVSEYANDSFYTAGLLVRSVVKDAAGKSFNEVKNTYSLVDALTNGDGNPSSKTASQFPKLTQTQRYFYEGTDTPQKSTTISYTYDSLGNVTRVLDYGDRGDQDDLQVDTTYSSSYPACAQAYVVGLKKSEKTTSNGMELRRTENTIDCTTGDVTSTSQYLDSTQAAVTDFVYFANGNLQRVTHPANLHSQRYQVTYAYDTDTQTYVTGTTDSFGYASSAAYDPTIGQPLSTTDVNGNVVSYKYDSFGRVLSVTGPFQQGGGLPTISFEYRPEAKVPWAISRHADTYRGPSATIDHVTFIDGLGRTIQTKQSATIFTGADTAARDVMAVSGRVNYDFVGRPIAEYYPVTEALGSAGAFNTALDSVQPLRTTYDILDRPTRVTEPDGSTTTYAYAFGADRAGATQFETTVVDANGVAKKTYTNVRQQIVGVKEFNNGGQQTIWTSYRYDPLNRITEVSDDKLNVTRTAYDNLGRRTTIDSPDAGRTDTVYDLASNVIASVTPNLRAEGKRISYDYDFNRVTQIAYPDFPANNVSYTYGAPGAADNRAGRITRVVDGSGSQEMFYDKLGDVTKETKTVVGFTGAPPGVYTTQYLYDTWGRLQQLVYPDGEVLTYRYDSGGQLRQANGVKGSFSYNYANRLEYDKFGSRVFMEEGNGVRTTYAYNPANRLLTNLRAGKVNANPFQNINYTYDGVGNVRSLSNDVAVPAASQMGGPTSMTFRYDDLYRLTGASGSYRYAPNKQRTFSASMSYDTIHNIVSKQQTDQIVEPGGKANVQKPTTYSQTYLYNSPKPHAATHIGDRTYTYDADGNQAGWTADNNGTRRNIVWDEENRIQSIFNNGQQLRYTYDAEGQRVLKRGPQGETAYVNPYFTVRNGQVATKHIWAGTSRLASQMVKLDNTFEKDQYFYQADHLGSSNYVTDANGAIYQHTEYFPFGETWVDESSNTQRTPYLFDGKELDEESGLYYYGARYYDPRTSVWQSTDRVVGDYLDGARDGGFYDSTNLNLYAYTAQNPLKYTDPSGNGKKNKKNGNEKHTLGIHKGGIHKGGFHEGGIHEDQVKLRTGMFGKIEVESEDALWHALGRHERGGEEYDATKSTFYGNLKMESLYEMIDEVGNLDDDAWTEAPNGKYWVTWTAAKNIGIQRDANGISLGPTNKYTVVVTEDWKFVTMHPGTPRPFQ